MGFAYCPFVSSYKFSIHAAKVSLSNKTGLFHIKFRKCVELKIGYITELKKQVFPKFFKPNIFSFIYSF